MYISLHTICTTFHPQIQCPRIEVFNLFKVRQCYENDSKVIGHLYIYIYIYIYNYIHCISTLML